MNEVKVEPALRSDEWEDVMRDELSLVSALSHLGDGVGLVDEDGSAMGRRASVERHRHALMAAANYGLPAGHPGKITRTDVQALIDGADAILSWANWATAGPDATDEAQSDALCAVAAKLSALLPPEAP